MTELNPAPVNEHHLVELSPPRSARGKTPPGFRVLHVIVPERIFNQVKAQSYLSGMRFPEYVVQVLGQVQSSPNQPGPIQHRPGPPAVQNSNGCPEPSVDQWPPCQITADSSS